MFEELIFWAAPVVKNTLLFMALLEEITILSGHFLPSAEVKLQLISQHIFKAYILYNITDAFKIKWYTEITRSCTC